MATEKFGTLGRTTLNGAINDSVTSIVVYNTVTFPAVQFRIRIDTEIMIVTAISGKTLTVTRGAESTTAVAHSSNSNVVVVLTTGSNNQSLADCRQKGAYASLPAVEKAGRLYQTTDSYYQFRDNGSSWDGYGENAMPLTPLASGNYSWINQSGATADFTGGTLGFYHSTSTGGAYNMIYKTAPSTPYTITIHMKIWPVATANFNTCAMGFLDTGNGKFSHIQHGFESSGIMNYHVEKWNAYNSFSGTYTNGTFPSGNTANWASYLQLADNGTTRYYRMSWDGATWFTVYSVGRTDFATANAISLGLRQDGSDNAFKAWRIYSWIES